MGWDYKIVKSDLGYNICRVNKEDWLHRKEWLQDWTYTFNRDYAKTFFHEDDARSALVVARTKWRKTPTTSTKKSGYEGKRERTSWSEFS